MFLFEVAVFKDDLHFAPGRVRDFDQRSKFILHIGPVFTENTTDVDDHVEFLAPVDDGAASLVSLGLSGRGSMRKADGRA